MLNNLLIFIIVIVSGYLLLKFFKLNKRHVSSGYEMDEDKYNMEIIVNHVKNTFDDILKANLYNMNISKDEFHKKLHKRNQLRKALKSCTYGDVNAKNYVKDYIKDILLKSYEIDEFNINKIKNFDRPVELTVQDKFEILLYIYKMKHRHRALEFLITENGLDTPKQDEDGIKYFITEEEIEELYYKKANRFIKFEDKLNIIVQRIYQRYKGYGVVDEIRDMKIDGVSGGVSGIPFTFHEEIHLNENMKTLSSIPFSHDSVWIFYKGKTIHLSFLSFGTQKELMRVCKNIYRYNNPGQLSESNGYMVNEMRDGSRVVVARPPFSESWVFFVRKFDSMEQKQPEDLITDINNTLPIGLLRWLIKGCRVTAITGSQGTGKTTLLMSIIKFINPTFTLRIQEMAFELNLRKIYPQRNILTFRETGTISGQEGLDLQKKTDGTVNILGEVATAPVASWLIQMAQVASLFTIFTHHAKTSENLVLALRNNLLQTGVFNNESVAEKQVADVINFDIHLSKSINGHRYIERITEIIPLCQYRDYPDEYQSHVAFEERNAYFMDTMKEFFHRMTDRKTFETRDIVIWENGEYKAAKAISHHSYNQIIKHLTDQEVESFSAFMESNWRKTL